MRINVFIPHRWNYNDYEEISALLDRTKYNVRDYSVPSTSPFGIYESSSEQFEEKGRCNLRLRIYDNFKV